jgi:hypothetical protein
MGGASASHHLLGIGQLHVTCAVIDRSISRRKLSSVAQLGGEGNGMCVLLSIRPPVSAIDLAVLSGILSPGTGMGFPKYQAENRGQHRFRFFASGWAERAEVPMLSLTGPPPKELGSSAAEHSETRRRLRRQRQALSPLRCPPGNYRNTSVQLFLPTHLIGGEGRG